MNSTQFLCAEIWTERLNLLVHSLGLQICWIILPFIFFAVLFHFIEVVVQRRLIQRFGWQAALWTGWIGTPIHEASHVVMCWLFGHEIESVALFAPDVREGRLGYVRHTYHRGSWWQEAGNFFIGIAPLIGGAAVLLLVTWAMYPQLVQAFVAFSNEDHRVWEFDGATIGNLTDSGAKVLATSFNPLSLKFWLYVYLVLCITLHAAPSESDYRGGLKGGGILLAGWLSVNVAHAAFGLSVLDWFPVFQPLWVLLLVLLALSAVVAASVAGAVYVATLVWDQVRRT
ncbi:MAG: hypothetical protein Q8M16_21730 [Pirellulaceae bacterium]|nr:hypothetical protein [Pirellulaceae bacterium]